MIDILEDDVDAVRLEVAFVLELFLAEAFAEIGDAVEAAGVVLKVETRLGGFADVADIAVAAVGAFALSLERSIQTNNSKKITVQK